jgi:cyclase
VSSPDLPQEVADGLFAYAQHDGSWWVNTTGFVVGATQVVAIDACATERRTRALLAAIDATTGKPVRTLVNTHSHGDHTYGNSLFAGATIIGHERCRADLLADMLLAHTPPVFEPTPHWGDVSISPPTVTFTERLTVWVDDLAIELIHVGGPAHTECDVVAWVPSRGVLFTGDMVFNGGTPMLLSGSVTGYLAALERIRAIGATTLVPGHGRPCGPEIFDDLTRYARFIMDSAVKARHAGLSPLEAARELDLGEFAGLGDPERVVLNLHRAYADLDPTVTVDILAAFADAISYNGGRPLRCVV